MHRTKNFQPQKKKNDKEFDSVCNNLGHIVLWPQHNAVMLSENVFRNKMNDSIRACWGCLFVYFIFIYLFSLFFFCSLQMRAGMTRFHWYQSSREQLQCSSFCSSPLSSSSSAGATKIHFAVTVISLAFANLVFWRFGLKKVCQKLLLVAPECVGIH